MAMLLALFAFSVNADTLPCADNWNVFSQQSEGYAINSQCSSEGYASFSLEPMGRIVLTTQAASDNVELVCDNNGSSEVILEIDKVSATLGLRQPQGQCQWSGSLFTCEGGAVEQLFCTESKRIISQGSDAPILTASASWRSSPFTFSYKQEIIAGVEIITPKIKACKQESESVTGLQASWTIDASGNIQNIKLGTDDKSLSQCVKKVMADYRFPEHGFAKQYWRQVFF